jgi:hypothetical protein
VDVHIVAGALEPLDLLDLQQRHTLLSIAHDKSFRRAG